jgi:hypothetical protein
MLPVRSIRRKEVAINWLENATQLRQIDANATFCGVRTEKVSSFTAVPPMACNANVLSQSMICLTNIFYLQLQPSNSKTEIWANKLLVIRGYWQFTPWMKHQLSFCFLIGTVIRQILRYTLELISHHPQITQCIDAIAVSAATFTDCQLLLIADININVNDFSPKKLSQKKNNLRIIVMFTMRTKQSK